MLDLKRSRNGGFKDCGGNSGYRSRLLTSLIKDGPANVYPEQPVPQPQSPQQHVAQVFDGLIWQVSPSSHTEFSQTAAQSAGQFTAFSPDSQAECHASGTYCPEQICR